MQTKLTLRIDDKTVAKAKRISKKRQQSVSKMFEEHIKGLSEKRMKSKSGKDIPEWIRQLGGGKKPKRITVDPRLEYLMKKHVK